MIQSSEKRVVSIPIKVTDGGSLKPLIFETYTVLVEYMSH